MERVRRLVEPACIEFLTGVCDETRCESRKKLYSPLGRYR